MMQYAYIKGGVGIGRKQFIYVVLRPERVSASESQKNFEFYDEAFHNLRTNFPDALLTSEESVKRMIENRRIINNHLYIEYIDKHGNDRGFTPKYK